MGVTCFKLVGTYTTKVRESCWESAPNNLIKHCDEKYCALMSGDSIMTRYERTSSIDSLPCKDGETSLLALNTIVEIITQAQQHNDCWTAVYF